MAPAGGPPRAPVPALKPAETKPVAPAASAAAPATPVAKPAAAEGAPTVKPTLKKETVRIDVPAAAKLVPQATVKIQSAPAPTRPPVAEVRTVPALVTTTATTIADDEDEAVASEDPTMRLVAGGVLAFAAVTFGLQLWTFLTN